MGQMSSLGFPGCSLGLLGGLLGLLGGSLGMVGGLLDVPWGSFLGGPMVLVGALVAFGGRLGIFRGFLGSSWVPWAPSLDRHQRHEQSKVPLIVENPDPVEGVGGKVNPSLRGCFRYL